MQDFGLKNLAIAGLTALGCMLVISAVPVKAADLEEYAVDEETAARPSVQRRVVIEESYRAPRVERHVIERRVIENPVVEHRPIERQVIERRVIERRVIERRVVQPVVDERVVERPPVVRRVIEHPAEPVLLPPQYVPSVPVQRVVRPVVEERALRREPVEECRTIVTERVDAFGERIVQRTRTCY